MFVRFLFIPKKVSYTAPCNVSHEKWALSQEFQLGPHLSHEKAVCGLVKIMMIVGMLVVTMMVVIAKMLTSTTWWKWWWVTRSNPTGVPQLRQMALQWKQEGEKQGDFSANKPSALPNEIVRLCLLWCQPSRYGCLIHLHLFPLPSCSLVMPCFVTFSPWWSPVVSILLPGDVLLFLFCSLVMSTTSGWFLCARWLRH